MFILAALFLSDRHRVGRQTDRSSLTSSPSGPLNLTSFSNSAADWLDRFKPYIEDNPLRRRVSTHDERTARPGTARMGISER